MKAPSRLLFLGMGGPLSVKPLLWLIEHGFAPRQVAVPAHLLGAPGGAAELPVAKPLATCADVARKYDLPVIGITREWMARLAEQDCVTLLCACWPWRLPDQVLGAFTHGAYNLHPSLLPRYRGPAPLFWQLRDGVAHTGITLHRLSTALDGGAIIGQRSLAVDDQATEHSLADELGSLSTQLLAQWTAAQLAHGAATPQNEAESSYQPAPRPGDFVLPNRWPAQRAYRFIHGTAGRGHPYQIDLGRKRIRVRDAIAYHPGQALRHELETSGQGLRVRFDDGVVDLVPF